MKAIEMNLKPPETENQAEIAQLKEELDYTLDAKEQAVRMNTDLENENRKLREEVKLLNEEISKITTQFRRNKTGKYEQIGLQIGKLVDEKNRAYGDAFSKSGDFLKILYPNGIKPDQYKDMLALVRVFDKQMRIATDKDALGENPWNDISGYGILMSE